MKNRLIGILVLLVVGMIAWSLFFDNDVEYIVDISPRIETETEYVEKFELEKPERDLFDEEEIVEAEQALEENQALPAEKFTQKSMPKEVKADIEKLSKVENKQVSAAQSWTLQVASYIEFDKAEDLVKRLRSAGYKAYTEKVNINQGQRVRVFVGPNVKKAALMEVKSRIDDQFKVDSIVTKYKAN